jgi:hypothetical protein
MAAAPAAVFRGVETLTAPGAGTLLGLAGLGDRRALLCRGR